MTRINAENEECKLTPFGKKNTCEYSKKNSKKSMKPDFVCIQSSNIFTKPFYYCPPLSYDDITNQKTPHISCINEHSVCTLSLANLGIDQNLIDTTKCKNFVTEFEDTYKSYFRYGEENILIGNFLFFETACYAHSIAHTFNNLSSLDVQMFIQSNYAHACTQKRKFK